MSKQHSESSQSASLQKKKFNFWKWFWLGTIPVSLGWLWHDFYAPDNKVTWAKDFASAEQQAAKTDRPMILFFTGAWCSPCRIMKREVWADHEVESIVNTRFIPVMIDVDDPKVAAVRNRYKVGATPVTIVTDPKGNVLRYALGGIGKSDFFKLLATP